MVSNGSTLGLVEPGSTNVSEENQQSRAEDTSRVFLQMAACVMAGMVFGVALEKSRGKYSSFLHMPEGMMSGMVFEVAFGEWSQKVQCLTAYGSICRGRNGVSSGIWRRVVQCLPANGRVGLHRTVFGMAIKKFV